MKTKVLIILFIISILLVSGCGRYSYLLEKEKAHEESKRVNEERNLEISKYVSENNIQGCLSLIKIYGATYTNDCLYKIGIKNRDHSVCEYIVCEFGEKICSEVAPLQCKAIILNDISLCDDYPEEYPVQGKDLCKQLVNNWNN